MRKQIQSKWFVQQLSADLSTLSTIKKRLKTKKEEAKQAYKNTSQESSKEDCKALKISYVQAKIRFKIAKAAHKAAAKLVAPYVLKIAVEEHTEGEKNIKHKEDLNGMSNSSKEVKIKKNSKSKKEKDHTEAKVTTIKKEKVQVAKSDKASKETKSHIKIDDLTVIEGIGPKIAQVLQQNDVHTFSDLAFADTDALKDLLQSKKLRLADPTTWKEQAQLAAEGKIKELDVLKKELKHGKRV